MVNKKISTRFFSGQQEQSVAKLINGRTVANSGARPFQKGDTQKASDLSDPENYKAQESWLIECKTCMQAKQSFAIKKQWLETIKEEAFQAGKMNYCLAFNFGPNQPNYYILSEDKFKQLFGEE
jgi:hypothetical protein